MSVFVASGLSDYPLSFYADLRRQSKDFLNAHFWGALLFVTLVVAADHLSVGISHWRLIGVPHEERAGAFEEEKLRAWKLYLDTEKLRVMRRDYIKRFVKKLGDIS